MPSSTRSTDSFDLVSIGSDDRIVWPMSPAAAHVQTGVQRTAPSLSWADDRASLVSDADSDDEYIVLRRPGPRVVRHEDVPADDVLAPAFAELSVEDTRAPSTPPPTSVQQNVATTPTAAPKAAKSKNAKVDPRTTATPTPPASPKNMKKKKKAKSKATPPSALKGTTTDDILFSAYQEAVTFITSFLSDSSPLEHDKRTQLTFLQALIIELGLYTPSSTTNSMQLPSPPASPSPHSNADGVTAVPPSILTPLADLPRTLTSARAALKQRVFLNVRDYLAVRGDGAAGPAPLQQLMHPSRKALVKDLHSARDPPDAAAAVPDSTGGKRRRRMAPVAWVKSAGLGVLLVSCSHR